MSLRIDTPIKPVSYLRLLLYISLAAIMAIVVWNAHLLLWQWVLILAVSAAVVGYIVLSRPILLHVSQPPRDQRIDKNWQLLLRTSHGDALWQAELVKVHRYHFLTHLEFKIIEPYKKPLTVTIFRDQTNAEEWRELNVLANIIPATVV